MITRIRNARIISNEIIEDKYLYIVDGIILSLTSEHLPFDNEIDAENLYLSPGFIDIHTHGGGGYDFGDGDTESILLAAKTHFKHGTTTIFPTCTSSSHSDMLNCIRLTREAMRLEDDLTPHIEGAHLEGPYFSLKQSGAQNPEYIKAPDKKEYEEFFSAGEGTLRRISFAPELEGSLELCRFLHEHNIVSAFAHTDAIYEEIMPCINEGCRLATHLYSGMNMVTRRNAYRKLGAVETAFLCDDVTVEVIADGCHLPPELLKLIYKIKGASRIALVTDSMRGAGMPEGPSVLGPKNDGMDCIITNGVAMLPDMSAFAGSVATADRLVRTMYKLCGIPLTECIKMMCETPARVMNIKNRGKLLEGYSADIVLFDDNINIKRVIKGK